MSDFLWPHGLQHPRLDHHPCPSPSPGDCSNSCAVGLWRYPTISSSVIPFSSCLKSFPASGSLLMSQLFASGGQSIAASASASVLLMNILLVTHLPHYRATKQMAHKLQNNYTEESKPWNLIITQSPHSVQISLFFTPCPFAVPGPHAAFWVTLRHRALCAPIGCDSSSGLPCVWRCWWFWRILVRCFVNCSSIWVCLMFFLMIQMRLWFFGEEDHEGKVPSS